MFVTLTQSAQGVPLLVNLERVLYAYRDERTETTVLVFARVAPPAGSGAKLRSVAVKVTETLQEIQQKRRMASR